MTFERALILDEQRSITDRVDHIIEHMTLEEKTAQIVGVRASDLVDASKQFAADLATPHIGHGVGHVTRVAAATFLPPLASARLANRIQRYLVEETRLGIPAIVHEESCAGYMARGGTTFPQAIGLASTWEPELVERMAGVIRQQMRAAGAHHALAPVLDVNRDPRWGRIEETYGEDPFLITALGLAYIRGLQAGDLRTGIAATGKHFLAHGVPEGGLNWAPVHVGERELREIFLTPFKAAIQQGSVASIMNAYH
ncbi:MAG: beta-glucosidase, partial [Anaerolineae bacterium]|nr:beta-glucosidase [Anaerolineae bacterium]